MVSATLAPSTAPIGSDLDRIRGMDTATLREELASALKITARQLVYLAAVWKELESRGEDLSALRTGLVAYLPHIAAGTVVAEAVVAFAGNHVLLRAVTALPPEEQKRLAAGASVRLVVKQGEQFTHRMLPCSALTASQVRQVFAPRAVRTEAEQIALLEDTATPWKAGRPVKRGNVVADRKTGTVRIGRSEAPAKDVIDALKKAGMV